jgi:hypothetical protein
MLRFARPICFAASFIAAATVVACGGKTPSSPTPPPTSTTVTIAAPVVKSPVGGAQLDTLSPTMEVTNAVTTGSPGAVTYRFEASELDSFPDNTRTFVADGVAQGTGTTTTTVPGQLISNFSYFWRARATNGTVTSDWSKVETFKTLGKFNDGRRITDPLLDGTTVGIQHGGRFIQGQGWQSVSLNDSIDYPIQTCSNCTLEFDVVGFGKEEGAPFGLDVKWFTMGDGGTFGNFGAFRDHPWKMHMEQRADDDTGVKMVWRNGDAGDGDPGDHTFKGPTGISWSSGHQPPYHFEFTWTESGFQILVDGHTIVADGFSRPYAPPNHTLSLGCRPRGETMIGAIWSNVRLTRR